MKKMGTEVVSVTFNSLQRSIIKDWLKCRDDSAFMEDSGKLLYIYMLKGFVK